VDKNNACKFNHETATMNLWNAKKDKKMAGNIPGWKVDFMRGKRELKHLRDQLRETQSEFNSIMDAEAFVDNEMAARRKAGGSGENMKSVDDILAGAVNIQNARHKKVNKNKKKMTAEESEKLTEQMISNQIQDQEARQEQGAGGITSVISSINRFAHDNGDSELEEIDEFDEELAREVRGIMGKEEEDKEAFSMSAPPALLGPSSSRLASIEMSRIDVPSQKHTVDEDDEDTLELSSIEMAN
jgi:hypothetical protein